MFNKIGDIILRIFSLIGAIILAIPKIPQKIRNFDSDRIKNKMDTDNLKENVSKVSNNLGIQEKNPNTKSREDKTYEPNEKSPNSETLQTNTESSKKDVILISTPFTSKEKENTIFRLQILSAGFLIITVVYLFNFLNIIFYVILEIIIALYIFYLLFKRIKLMYGSEFPAYRDFFLMYLCVGIILLIVGSNTNIVMAFSFQYFPSLTILIFAIICVIAVFFIFRIKYHRKFTYGVVIETGNKMAYVKVEYDIRSNVKPDVYAVINAANAKDGDRVKLETEEKIFSNSGNKPVSILEIVPKI
jgi:uncharacterized membrane protein